MLIEVLLAEYQYLIAYQSEYKNTVLRCFFFFIIYLFAKCDNSQQEIMQKRSEWTAAASGTFTSSLTSNMR